MFKRIWFIFWMLIALFICVPILNTVILNWTSAGGILDQTFNASNPQAWNATGEIVSSNQTSVIPLTGLETAFTQGYVWLFVLFFGGIIFYVLGKAWSNRGGNK
jgi:uncharacterized SAM-binding protein YcdF (DUF218 family)